MARRLATALYVKRETPDSDARARRLSELKPHVPFDQARAAVAAVDRVAQEAGALLSG
jgi:hypothetical protein